MNSEAYSSETQQTMGTLHESQENSAGNRKWVSKFLKSFSSKKREKTITEEDPECLMGEQVEYSLQYAGYNGMLPVTASTSESNLSSTNKEDKERNEDSTNIQTDEHSYPRSRVSTNILELETIEIEEGGNIKGRKTTLRKTGRFLHRLVEEEQNPKEPTDIFSEFPKLIKAGKLKLDEPEELSNEESSISTADKSAQEENERENVNSEEQVDNEMGNAETKINESKNPFMTDESTDKNVNFSSFADKNENNEGLNEIQKMKGETRAFEEEPYQDVENILQTLTDTIKCIEDREIAELLVRLRNFKRDATMLSSDTGSSGKAQKKKLWKKSKEKQAAEMNPEANAAVGDAVEYNKEETMKCFGRQKKKLHPSYSRPTITLTMSKEQMSRLSEEEQSTVIQMLRREEQEEILHLQDIEKRKTFNIIKKPTLINGSPIEEFNLSMEDLLNEPEEIRDEILQITHSLAQEDKQEEKEEKNKKKKKKEKKKKKGMESELTTEELSETEQMLREEQLKKDLMKLKGFPLMVGSQKEEQKSIDNFVIENESLQMKTGLQEPSPNERPLSQQSLRDELEKEKIMNEMLSREKELYIKLDNENAELETLQRIREENGIEEDTTELLEREEKLKDEIELTKTEIEILQRQQQQKKERERHHIDEMELIEEYPSKNNKNKQTEQEEYALFIKKVKKEWENSNEKNEPIKVVSMSFNELVSLPDSIIQLSLNSLSPDDRTTLLNSENKDQKYNFIIYEDLAKKGPLGRNFEALKGNKSKVESMEEALAGEAATLRISHNQLVDLSDEQIEIILNQLNYHDRKSIMWTQDDDHEFTFYLLNPEDDMVDNEKENKAIGSVKKGKEKLVDKLKLKKNKKQVDEQNEMTGEYSGNKSSTDVIEITKADYDKLSAFEQNEIKKLLTKKDLEELKHSEDPDKIHIFYKGETKKHMKHEKERLNEEKKNKEEKKKQKKDKKKEKYDEEEDDMYRYKTEEEMIDYLQQNEIALFLDINDLRNMMNTQHSEIVNEKYTKQTAVESLDKQKNYKKKKSEKKKKKKYEVIRISKKELFDRSPSGQKEIIDSLEEQDIRKLLATNDPYKIHGFFVKEIQKYTWGNLKSSTIDRLKGNHRKTLQDFQEEIERKRRAEAENMDGINESIKNEKNKTEESNRILQLQKLLETEKVEGASDVEQARIEQVLSEEELKNEGPFIVTASSNIHQKRLSDLHADILSGKKSNYVIILSKGVLLRQTPYIRKEILEMLEDQEAAIILTEENPKKVFTLPLKKQTQIQGLYNSRIGEKEEGPETGKGVQRSETWKEMMRRKAKEMLEKKDKKKKEKDENKKKSEVNKDETIIHNVDVCYSDDGYIDEVIEEKPLEVINNMEELETQTTQKQRTIEDDEIPGPSGITSMKLEIFNEENKGSIDGFEDCNDFEQSSLTSDQIKTQDLEDSTYSLDQTPYKINPATTRIVLAPFQFDELSAVQQKRLLNLISELDKKIIKKSFKKKINKQKQYVFEVTDATTNQELTPEPYMKVYLSQNEFFRLNDKNQKRVLNFLPFKGQQKLLGTLKSEEQNEYHLKPKYAPDEISLSDLNLSEMETEKQEHKLLRLCLRDLDSYTPEIKKQILSLIPKKEQTLILKRKDPMESLIVNLNKKYKKKISKATKANLDAEENALSDNAEVNDNMDSKGEKEAKKKRKKEKKEEKKKKKEEKKRKDDSKVEEKDNEAEENQEKEDGEDDKSEGEDNKDKKKKKKEKKKKDKKEKKKKDKKEKKKKSKKGDEIEEDEEDQQQQQQQNVDEVKNKKDMDLSEELSNNVEPIYVAGRGLDGIMEPLTVQELENTKRQQIDINREQEQKEIVVELEAVREEEPEAVREEEPEVVREEEPEVVREEAPEAVREEEPEVVREEEPEVVREEESEVVRKEEPEVIREEEPEVIREEEPEVVREEEPEVVREEEQEEIRGEDLDEEQNEEIKEEKLKEKEGEVIKEEDEEEETSKAEIGKKRTEKKNYLENSTYADMDKIENLNEDIFPLEPKAVNYRFVSEDEFLDDVSNKYLADIPKKNQKKLLKKLKNMKNFDDLRIIEEIPEVDYEKELQEIANISLDQYKDTLFDDEPEETLDDDLDMVYSLTIEPSKLTVEQKTELLKKLPYSEDEVADIISKFKKNQSDVEDQEEEETEEEEAEPSTYNEDNPVNMNLPFPDILNFISVDYLINLPQEELKEFIGVLTAEDYDTIISINEPEEKMQLLKEKIEGYNYKNEQETEEMKETKEKWLKKLKNEGMKHTNPLEKQKGKKKKKKYKEKDITYQEGDAPIAVENYGEIEANLNNLEGETSMGTEDKKDKKKKKKKIRIKKMFAKKKLRQLYEMVEEDTSQLYENVEKENTIFDELWNVEKENLMNKIPQNPKIQLAKDLSEAIEYNDDVYYWGNAERKNDIDLINKLTGNADTQKCIVLLGFLLLCLFFFRTVQNKTTD